MLETAVFGAGCFWGIEAEFKQLKGVQSTTVGYMGGTLENPTYEDVCSHKTGHAEVVQVHYDPSVVSYNDLLKLFWEMHDPTTLNRQGPDIGTQYRSVIFYYNERQKEQAIISMNILLKSGKFKKPVVTQIVPATEFYKAEEYHQDYFGKHNIKGVCH